MSRSGSSGSKRSARISGRGLKPARQITRDQLLGHIKPTLPLKLDHGVEKVVTMKCGGFLKCKATDLRPALALLWLSIGSCGPKNRSLQRQRRRPPPVESTYGPRVRKDRRVLL
jgi:hypothetical protein